MNQKLPRWQRIVLHLLAVCVLFLSGCHSASFLQMQENYGISLPANCTVLETVSVFAGFDRIALHKLQYEEDTVSELFRWKEFDDSARKEIDQIFSVLKEDEQRDPSIHASGLIAEITEKYPELLYDRVSEKKGIVCYLLFDRANLVMYVCEAND